MHRDTKMAQLPRNCSSDQGKQYPEPCPSHPDLDWLWAEIRRELSGSMTRAAFDSHIRLLEPVSCGNGVLTLYAPSAQSRAWIEGRLMGIVRRAVRAVAGQDLKIELVY